MAARYFVALGSNLDDRLALLEAALDRLAATDGVELRARASVWETRPVGPGTGPYLNTVAELVTSLDPHALLERLAAIERALGRVRVERWGDRRIDLDLIAGFDERGAEITVDDEVLRLPHPRLHERDFVLRPLVELDAEVRVGGQRCADHLAALAPEHRTLVDVICGPERVGPEP